jgi:hypothetical protein
MYQCFLLSCTQESVLLKRQISHSLTDLTACVCSSNFSVLFVLNYVHLNSDITKQDLLIFLCRDLQSYLAELTIFLCPYTKKFFILLDNRPWLVDQDTKPAHLWQLMVTKVYFVLLCLPLYLWHFLLLEFHGSMLQTDSFYFVLQSRLSPFANTKTRRKRNETEGNIVLSERVSAAHKPSRWYSVIDEAMQEKKLQVNKLKDSRMLNRELHQTLYGFIIFEVDWPDVRGINYLNELQVLHINVNNPTFREMSTSSME